MRKALLDSFLWRGVYFFTTLLLNVCIARIYEASQSGWIYFISNNFYLVLLVGSLSLDSSMTYFAASGKIGHQKLASIAIAWPFIIAIFSVVCTFVFTSTGYITSDYFFLLAAGAAYTFGISLNNFFTSLFYAKQSFAVPNIYMSIINAIVIVLIPFFAKGWMGLNRDQFLYIYFMQFVLQGVGLTVLYINRYSPVKTLNLPSVSEYKMLFRFTIVALFANIAYYLINRVDYLFVEAWCPAKSLGNYVQVSKMGQLFLIIPSIISSAVYPLVAKDENSNMARYILRMMILFVVLYIFIMLGSYIYGNQLFIWLFGDTFDEMYRPFLVLLPGILFLSLHIVIAAFFGAKNRPFYNVISTATGLAVVLIGDVLLIKRMGITGAALVSSVGYTTCFVVSFILFMHSASVGWQDIFTPEIFKLKTYTSLIANRSANSK